MGETRGRLEQLTCAVGLLAVLVVVGTVAAAAVVHTVPGPGPGAPHVVRAVPDAGLQVALRLADGWSAAAPEAVAGFPRPDGRALAVSGPVYFRRGWCAKDPRWSSRAFAGVTPLMRATSARRAGDQLTREWTEVLASALGPDPRPGAGSTPPARASPVRLGERSGWVTTREATLSATGPCLPPRVAVDALTVDAGAGAGGVVAVVVVRDAGVQDALTASAARDFLRATRVLPQSLRSRT